jgi:hypothetical protein
MVINVGNSEGIVSKKMQHDIPRHPRVPIPEVVTAIIKVM